MKKTTIFGLSLFLMLFLLFSTSLAEEVALIEDATIDPKFTNENLIEGSWFTENKHVLIKIYKKENSWCGEITWLKDPITRDPKSPAYGKEAIDFRNPDPAFQSRLIIGINILQGFVWNGKKFVGGTIYDPDLGKTYKCQMAFKNKNTLKIRGYVGIPLLGRTEFWLRKIQ